MGDRQSRSDAEREAARWEREARRAKRLGRPAPNGPLPVEPQPGPVEPSPLDAAQPVSPVAPEAVPPVAPKPVPPATPEPVSSVAPTPEPIAFATAADDHHAADDDEPSTGQHEVPAGTRRVSAYERPPGQSRVKRQPRRINPTAPLGGRRRHSYRARVAAMFVVILAGAVIWFVAELFQPFHGSPHGRVIVRIPANSSADRVADLLAHDGVISSSFFFGLRTRLDGDRGKLLSGTYRLQLGMSYGSVLTALTTPPKQAPTTPLTLIPGKTRKMIDTLLQSQHIRGSYVAATRQSSLLNPGSYGAPRSTPDLEGFLFPDTYQLRDPISIDALVTDQLTEFKKQFATVNLSYAKRHNLTAYDVLIIASMIEGEAATQHDRLLVSSVIYNRLRLGMPLGIDATTRYATGNYTEPLTNAQINSSSPYNTRVHTGLPPTPIDSPSLASIDAAAHPVQSKDLYFVVTPCGNGSMTFTGSYSQFLRDSAAYQQARSARGGKSPEHCS